MGLYKDHGVVLRTMRLGEADRIVTLLTHDHGKIRAVVKGVRKTKSRFGARLEPFGHVDLLIYEGRSDLQIVSQAELVTSFAGIRRDYEAFCCGQLFSEAVDLATADADPNPRLVRLLLAGWATLAARAEAGASVPHALRPAFLLKLLGVTGFAPGLRHCVACGGDGLAGFSLDAGGVVCSACRGSGDVRLHPASIELLQEMWRTPLEEIPDVHAGEVDGIVAKAVEYHLDRRLRSLQLGRV